MVGHVRQVLFQTIFATLMFASLTSAVAETPCGLGNACEVEGGDYHLRLPTNYDGTTSMPTLLWFHGHRSSGESALKSATIAREFTENGYLVIAPNGALRPNSDIRGWPGRLDNPFRDDLTFVHRVLADVKERLPINEEQVYVSGFSAGGSMAWMLACFDGERYAAFAPVAGTLRQPNPVDAGCPGGPVRLLHIHGLTDRQVPLEGRGIRDWHQGDVFATMRLARHANQCLSQPSEFSQTLQYQCRSWNECGSGVPLELCLHDGGHGLPKGWAEVARQWFEATPIN